MICSNCQKNQAVYRIHSTKNGKKTETLLCMECADNSHINTSNNKFLQDFINKNTFVKVNTRKANNYSNSNITVNSDNNPENISDNNPENISHICPTCGLNPKTFKTNGKFGCVECFKIFRPQILQIANKVQGTLAHTGKSPKNFTKAINTNVKIDKLKLEIKKAIELEEYEKAAEIRDEIKLLQANSQPNPQEFATPKDLEKGRF